MIPIPREALARNPFEYVTAPPHMPTDRQHSEQTAALAPSPAALEAWLDGPEFYNVMRLYWFAPGPPSLLAVKQAILRALSPASAPHEE